MLQPSTDVNMTTRQVLQSKDIPNFPYTETPILPKEVYRKGLTSKEKLQYLPGMDPIFVVKQPVFYRPKPPGLMVPPDVLRSTWVLLNGTWTKVEHRAPPPEQAVRFDKWVERACFQYHSPNQQPLIPDTVSQLTHQRLRPIGCCLQSMSMPSLPTRDPFGTRVCLHARDVYNIRPVNQC